MSPSASPATAFQSLAHKTVQFGKNLSDLALILYVIDRFSHPHPKIFDITPIFDAAYYLATRELRLLEDVCRTFIPLLTCKAAPTESQDQSSVYPQRDLCLAIKVAGAARRLAKTPTHRNLGQVAFERVLEAIDNEPVSLEETPDYITAATEESLKTLFNDLPENERLIQTEKFINTQTERFVSLFSQKPHSAEESLSVAKKAIMYARVLHDACKSNYGLAPTIFAAHTKLTEALAAYDFFETAEKILDMYILPKLHPQHDFTSDALRVMHINNVETTGTDPFYSCAPNPLGILIFFANFQHKPEVDALVEIRNHRNEYAPPYVATVADGRAIIMRHPADLIGVLGENPNIIYTPRTSTAGIDVADAYREHRRWFSRNKANALRWL